MFVFGHARDSARSIPESAAALSLRRSSAGCALWFPLRHFVESGKQRRQLHVHEIDIGDTEDDIAVHDSTSVENAVEHVEQRRLIFIRAALQRREKPITGFLRFLAG